MVKHIKKAYSKDGKLTKREKSIAYATAWKDHNEEINYPKDYDPPKRKPPSEKELNKMAKYYAKQEKKKNIKGYHAGDAGVPVNEDARYDSSIGGHEWGTPQGTDYFKSLTPGQSNPKEDPIKPLAIKARKPEDEKAVKVTEAYPVYKTPEYHARMKAKDAKLRKYREDLAKKAKSHIKRTTSESLIKQFEPEYSEAKRRIGNKIRSKVGIEPKPEKDWKKDMKKRHQLQKWRDYYKEDKGYDLDQITPLQAEYSKEQYPEDNKDESMPHPEILMKITQADIDFLDNEVANFTFNDAVKLGLYAPEELGDDDFDNTPGFDNEVNITEVLTVQGRMKRRFAARRNRQKLKVARGIALSRGSTPDRLKRRATSGARLLVYKRLLRGRDRASLPPAEKARLERMIKRYAPLVQRVAVKMLPQMRKNEINRMKSRGKRVATRSKKYRAAKPIRGAASQKAKRYKIKKPGKYKAPKPKKFKSRIGSGGPTIKKKSTAYKAFTFSIG